MHCGTKRMKKMDGGHVRKVDNIQDANKSARREMMSGGRVKYAKGGQPMYKHGECPKGKPC